VCNKPELKHVVFIFALHAIDYILLFPFQDGENKVVIINRRPKSKPATIDIESTGFDSPLSKRPLILSRTCKIVQLGTTNCVVAKDPEGLFELPLVSDTGISRHSDLSEMQTAPCGLPGDSGRPTVSCLALSSCNEPRPKVQADSIGTELCCESLGLSSDGEENVDAALGHQTYSFVPIRMVTNEPTASFLEERGPCEGEHISVYEHSYCRSDTEGNRLWRKILSLHAKILELDHREESTLAKVRALETEVALLKRDGAVFKKKQNTLEDHTSSTLR